MSQRIIRTKLVGVTFRNDDGSKRQSLIRRRCRPGTVLRAIREPENEFDSDAICGWARGWLGRWGQIGYLSADLAGDLAELVDEGDRLTIRVLDVTGGWFRSRGVNVEIEVEGIRDVVDAKPKRRTKKPRR